MYLLLGTGDKRGRRPGFCSQKSYSKSETNMPTTQDGKCSHSGKRRMLEPNLNIWEWVGGCKDRTEEVTEGEDS